MTRWNDPQGEAVKNNEKLNGSVFFCLIAVCRFRPSRGSRRVECVSRCFFATADLRTPLATQSLLPDRTHYCRDEYLYRAARDPQIILRPQVIQRPPNLQ